MGNCDKNSCPVGSFNWCAFQQWIRTASLVAVAVAAVMFVRDSNDRADARDRMMRRMQSEQVQPLNNGGPRRGDEGRGQDAPRRGN